MGRITEPQRHGFEVTPEQVEATLLCAEQVIPQSGGRFIVPKGSPRHVLRVVYREETDPLVVIAFFPGPVGLL